MAPRIEPATLWRLRAESEQEYGWPLEAWVDRVEGEKVLFRPARPLLSPPARLSCPQEEFLHRYQSPTPE